MKKLVRDKIPEIITNSGKTPITHIASEQEYWQSLKEKLSEEVEEFLQAENKEEMADILEVLHAICEFKKFDLKEIETIQKKKADERGGFGNKIILDEVK
ncbi:MAG TPA: nucleoside triphosphate pyrophosphohydrolase [Nanoarchaeota archaeon]|nr:nucleoside triphosphate pyrophosphohydrolase [Nanoarchaeota archaeon]